MKRAVQQDTHLLHVGRHPECWAGAVNPPVWRASTILSQSLEEQERSERDKFNNKACYGREGTPTSFALEEAIAAIEGGTHSAAVCSGLAAVAGTLTALLESGSHLLMTDGVYGATRTFCDNVLAKFGIETTYYDPHASATSLSELMRPNTKVVFTESPSSTTTEVQDIPAIATVAHSRGALVVMDNTWGVCSFQPFDKGVDVSIQSATKYIAGHADAVVGAITTRDESLYRRVRSSVSMCGYCVGSEEAWLALRGIRTLRLRLQRHLESSIKVAQWLEGRPEVARVLHPALPSHPDHAMWQRDFSGGAGLFVIELRPVPQQALTAMTDGLKLFGIGLSWGGFESLVIQATTDPKRAINFKRVVSPSSLRDPVLRFHIGLENVDDLIADLTEGFKRLHATMQAG